MKKWMMALGFFTAAAVIIYWIAVFSGLFPVTEIIPGYTFWFMSFPIADLWLATCSFFYAHSILKQNPFAPAFGFLTGSSLIFLGLYALLYGINTKLIFTLTTDEVIEIIIKLYCLGVGTLTIITSWQQYKTLLQLTQAKE